MASFALQWEPPYGQPGGPLILSSSMGLALITGYVSYSTSTLKLE